MKKYDVLVIGTGPGGEGASMRISKGGKKVAVIERAPEIGGGCCHWGTIPSKSLRHSIQQFVELKNNPFFPFIHDQIKIDFPTFIKSAGQVISKQVKMRENFYYRNDVDIITGSATFIDAHTLAVTDAEGVAHQYSADHIVIATGSRPYHPPDINFNHPRILDSDTILKMNMTPKSMIIYGAGVIGCEYASIFKGLDVKINLINTRDKLMSFLDDEISDALSYHLREQGTVIRHNEEYEQVEPLDDGVMLHLKSGKKIKTDVILWANGRIGNSQNMGLEKIGIKTNSRGQLDVNENYQTNLPHVYAVGDIIGYPSLASAAYDQGRLAGTHIVEGTCDFKLVEDFPTGIFTNPEISSVGKTERQLTEEKIPYEVGNASFKSLARAQITGKTVGMLKILFHSETLEILGVHCFGSEATEIVHIGQAIRSQKGEKNSLLYFMHNTFNYPTMAEAYRVAALNGYNRLH